MSEKIMIFMDGANILKAAKRINIRIDYNKLKDKLSENRQLVRAYFFDAVPDPPPKPKQAFLDALRSCGITVITKKLKKREIKCENCGLGNLLKEKHNVSFANNVKSGIKLKFDEEYQKGVDVALVTELLRMARENVYETAIVVSGDNDFSNAIECVKSMGKRVEVASFKNSLGYELKQVADKLTYLDRFTKEIELPPKDLNKS